MDQATTWDHDARCAVSRTGPGSWKPTRCPSARRVRQFKSESASPRLGESEALGREPRTPGQPGATPRRPAPPHPILRRPHLQSPWGWRPSPRRVPPRSGARRAFHGQCALSRRQAGLPPGADGLLPAAPPGRAAPESRGSTDTCLPARPPACGPGRGGRHPAEAKAAATRGEVVRSRRRLYTTPPPHLPILQSRWCVTDAQAGLQTNISRHGSLWVLPDTPRGGTPGVWVSHECRLSGYSKA